MTTQVLLSAEPVGQPAPRRPRGRKRDRSVPIITMIVIALLALLILYPLARVLVYAISEEGLAVITSMITYEVNRRILTNTMVLGVTVGAVGTLVGFLFAFVQVRVRTRGKRLLHLIALMPIVAPPFALATAVIALFGRRGMVTHGLFGANADIYGLPGLTLVMSLSFFPVAYMNFRGLLETMDPALDEAASNLGAGKLRIFLTVTLPMLVPGIAGSFLLLFVEAISDLANPLVLGGDYTVLASRAFIAITGEYDIPSGSAYSVVMLVPALLVFVIQRYWVARKNVVSVTGKPTGQPTLIEGGIGRVALVAVVGALAALVVLIYVTLFAGGFVRVLGVDNTLTLDHYRFVLIGVGRDAFLNTTTMSLFATPIAALLGMLVAWLVVRKLKRGSAAVDLLGMLGIAVPGTVLGIGYAISFNQAIVIGNLQFFPALGGGAAIMGGVIGIIMVYVTRSIPTAQRAGIASLQQIDRSIDEASTSLGADGMTTFRKITLPLIRPAFLTGLIYTFSHSMTTLSPIIFLTTPGVKIITKQILAEVEAGRFGNAFAFCTLLILIVVLVMGGLSFLLRKRTPELIGLETPL